MDKVISPPTNRLRVMALLIFLCLLCGGCTRKVYVPMETVRVEYKEADTTAIYNNLKRLFESKREKESKSDSVIDRSSEKVVVNEKGDTLKHEKERIIYVSSKHEKELEQKVSEQDSIINDLRTQLSSVKVDSVPVPYEVERKLTRWEEAKMDAGGFAMGGVAIALCIAVIWLIRKFRK